MTEQHSIKESLEEALTARELTIQDLVGLANDLLKRVAPRQTRYKVNERPDIRTIRYYINQKLLPRPESYQGGKARFSGGHLLRLLLIKKLQAEHQTLRQIARVLEQSSDARVQQLLVGEQPPQQPVSSSGSATPDLGRSGSPMRRLALHGGANLDLPAAVEQSPAARRALAEQLEALARMLRTHSDQNHETEGDES